MNIKAQLSPRESEIAEFMAWGAPKKTIARRLFISTRTVENTARNIYEKAQVNNVAQLAAWWFCKRFNISTMLNPMLASTMLVLMFLSQPALYLKIGKRVEVCKYEKIKIRSSNDDDDLFD